MKRVHGNSASTIPVAEFTSSDIDIVKDFRKDPFFL